MCAKNDAGSFGNLGEFFYKNCARAAEFVDDVLVMDNFFANVDGGVIKIQSNLYNVDGTNYTGAESAGL